MGSSAASSVMAAARERGLALIAAFGCALTRRQLTVLRTMRDREDADPGDEDAEIVREHGVAYLGDERVASRTVDALLRACAVKDVSSGSLERYRINGTGREILSGRGETKMDRRLFFGFVIWSLLILFSGH